jgi:hypothetical protein
MVEMAQGSAARVRRSKAERDMLVAGSVLLAVALPGALVVEDARAARVLGTVGLVLLLLWAGSRALRTYLAGERAALPVSIGRTAVPIAPARRFAALTVRGRDRAPARRHRGAGRPLPVGVAAAPSGRGVRAEQAAEPARARADDAQHGDRAQVAARRVQRLEAIERRLRSMP